MESNRCHWSKSRTSSDVCKYAMQYASMISNIPGTIYRGKISKDAGFMMEFMSDAVEELTGYPASDFVNNAVRSFSSIILSEDRKKAIHALFRGIALKSSFDVDYRINCADGSVKWISEKGKAQYNERGKLLWVDGACFDITDKKTMEAEFIQSEKLKGVLEMSGAVCHEMNQPMTSAMIHLQLLCDDLFHDFGENFPYRENIDEISNSINRMRIITNKLMGINRYRTQEYIQGQTIIDIDGSSIDESHIF